MFDMGTESVGLCCGVMDLKAGHTEFGFRVVSVEGGELADAVELAMSGDGLAVFVEDLDELLRDTGPDLLVHIDKGDGVEVFVHLNMAIGVDLSDGELSR